MSDNHELPDLFALPLLGLVLERPSLEASAPLPIGIDLVPLTTEEALLNPLPLTLLRMGEVLEDLLLLPSPLVPVLFVLLPGDTR